MCRVVLGTTTALGPVLKGHKVQWGETDSKQTNIKLESVINAVIVIKRKLRDIVLTNTDT